MLSYALFKEHRQDQIDTTVSSDVVDSWDRGGSPLPITELSAVPELVVISKPIEKTVIKGSFMISVEG